VAAEANERVAQVVRVAATLEPGFPDGERPTKCCERHHVSGERGKLPNEAHFDQGAPERGTSGVDCSDPHII
jgi:hypothetical protein